MAFDGITKFLVGIFGSRNERLLKGCRKVVEQINSLEAKYQNMPDSELAKTSLRLGAKIKESGKIEDVLPEAFAAVREVSDRHLGIRNVFVDEYAFDSLALGSEHLREIYQTLKEQVKNGKSIYELDVPVEFNAEIRRLYPESRPPFRFRHFDVQMIGGQVLFDGKIAEMATGEGKTLVATLAAYLTALSGKKVHVVTTNDYLAKRDAEWMGPVYRGLGLTVGAIQAQMDPGGNERKSQYACDITYGTNNEFGFDYLRDNMKISAEQLVQGPLEYAVVDEVDSILIDEARTPLIISGPAFDDVSRYKKADEVARKLIALNGDYDRTNKNLETARRDNAAACGELNDAKKARDEKRMAAATAAIEKTQKDIAMLTDRLEGLKQYYEVEYDRKSVNLTSYGIGAAQEIAGVGSFFTGSNIEWPHLLQQALRAHIVFEKEVDYVVKENRVVIVDQFTGRLMEGRQWSDGLHQAVEAKENVQIKEETQTLATITLQNFFKLYGLLAGMTGTAATEAQEFMDIYKLDVVVIPTNRVCVRKDYEDLIYKSTREKFSAIVDEIHEISSLGRPVLVGTISIEKSELISNALTKKYGVEHEVLNAKQHAREALIVAKAGHQHTNRTGAVCGNVTIATNMAGRGTDIRLGPGVAQLGGLHIVGTERHEARRIDNQLRGRAGRQGDAGSSLFFLSFEDDLLRLFMPEFWLKALTKVGWEEGEPIYHRQISRGIEKAQKKVEARNFEARKSLLDYDEVMDYQRKIFYGRRRNILYGIDLRNTIEQMVESVIDKACQTILSRNYPARCIAEWVRTNLNVEIRPGEIESKELPDIEETIKRRAVNSVQNDISIMLGEYLEDFQDKSTWHVEELVKWAMSTFGASLSGSKIRQMAADEIQQSLAAAAAEQIDNKDCSQLAQFLQEGFALRTFSAWANAKFDITIEPDELKNLDNSQIGEKVLQAVQEKYRRREIEYPVEFAMSMTYTPQGANPYAFDALSKWIRHKYLVEDISGEYLQHSKPEHVREKLLLLSSEFYNGRLESEINEKLSSLKPDALAAWANERFEADIKPQQLADSGAAAEIIAAAGRNFMRKELGELEKYVLLQIFDSCWKDHLYAMDHLKESIFLRAYAEKDPKVEYKQEGYRMFDEMLDAIEDRVTDAIFKVRLEAVPARRQSVYRVGQTRHDEVSQFAVSQRQRAAAIAQQSSGEQVVKQIKLDKPRVGRNDPCPCGSGKKYKKCCGANAS